MTNEIIKIEDARLVTVGVLKKVLKEERNFTLQELAKVDNSMIAIAKTFNQVQESISDLANLITRETSLIREENREFRMRMAQLDRTGLIHEQKIDELDTRVLSLETGK